MKPIRSIHLGRAVIMVGVIVGLAMVIAELMPKNEYFLISMDGVVIKKSDGSIVVDFNQISYENVRISRRTLSSVNSCVIPLGLPDKFFVGDSVSCRFAIGVLRRNLPIEIVDKKIAEAIVSIIDRGNLLEYQQ